MITKLSDPQQEALYRALAQEAFDKAEDAQDPSAAQMFQDMGKQWLEVAASFQN